MTLGNMRQHGVRSFAVACSIGHHEAIISPGPRMVCTKCGIVGADARPNASRLRTTPRPHPTRLAAPQGRGTGKPGEAGQQLVGHVRPGPRHRFIHRCNPSCCPATAIQSPLVRFPRLGLSSTGSLARSSDHLRSGSIRTSMRISCPLTIPMPRPTPLPLRSKTIRGQVAPDSRWS
jgi:hypothetical protein